MDENFAKYLETLNLDKNADLNEIKSTYRKLVKIHHPDLFNNPENKEKAEKNFRIITKAYEYLRDNYIPPQERNFDDNSNVQHKEEPLENNFTLYKTSKDENLLKLIKYGIEHKAKLQIKYKYTAYYKTMLQSRIITPVELCMGDELPASLKNPREETDENKMYLIAFCELMQTNRIFELGNIVYARLQFYRRTTEYQPDYEYIKPMENINIDSSNAVYQDESYGIAIAVAVILFLLVVLSFALPTS